MGINSVLEVIASLTPDETEVSSSEDASDAQGSSPRTHRHPQVTAAVRKALAPALRDLIQHGLMPVGLITSLIVFFQLMDGLYGCHTCTFSFILWLVIGFLQHPA